jgi:hypothetical protein
MLETLLSGAGFAFAAGLNASLALLILALADRVTSDDLDDPYSAISSNWGIVALLLILPIELVADKSSRLERANNLLHTAIRPLAGAIAFMAIASLDDELNIWLAGVLGFVIAGATHAWKVTERPRVTAATRGIGTPMISMLEDVVVVVVCIVSAFLPLANLVVLPCAAFLLVRTARSMELGKSPLMRMLRAGASSKVASNRLN